jgi:two-component system, LytTR family, response regulator
MKIRTFVVDDEPLARLNLISLLQAEPDFEISGVYADGKSAAEAIGEQQPDLVFLDVQMPALSGLDLAGALAQGAAPAIVFVTAHDRYAVQAFETQALDYLLKPFRRERFGATLDRVRQRFGATASSLPPSLRLGGFAGGGPATQRIAVKCGDRVVLVALDELVYVRAAANYVQLHVGDRIYEVREKISVMQLQLPADRFLRIHRSYLVSLAALLELYPVGGGDYMVALRNGKQLPVGPTYPASIRRCLAGVRLPRPGGGL